MSADPLDRLGLALRRYTATASDEALEAALVASVESHRARFPGGAPSGTIEASQAEGSKELDRVKDALDAPDVTPSPDARNRTLELAAAAFAEMAAEKQAQKQAETDEAAGTADDPLRRLSLGLKRYMPPVDGGARKANLRAAEQSFQAHNTKKAPEPASSEPVHRAQASVLDRLQAKVRGILRTGTNQLMAGGAAVATAAVAVVLVGNFATGPGGGNIPGDVTSEFPGGTRGISPSTPSGAAVSTLVEALDAGTVPLRDTVDAGALIAAFNPMPPAPNGVPLGMTASIVSAPWAADRDLLVVLIGTDPDGGALRDIETEISLSGMPTTRPLLIASSRPAGAIPGIASVNIGDLSAGQGYGLVFDLLPKPENGFDLPLSLIYSYTGADAPVTGRIEVPLGPAEDAEDPARSAAVIAGFAMLLRGDPVPPGWDYDAVLGALPADSALADLVTLAKALQ